MVTFTVALRNFENSVISIGICSIGSFDWGQKYSPQKFCFGFKLFTKKFNTLTNGKPIGLKVTSL